MAAIEFRCLSFTDLSRDELYALLQLRSQVFVVEQDCVFQDLDDCDQQALHVLGSVAGKLVCYARLLPAGHKYSAASIGRVVSARAVRRHGYGRLLVARCIEYCRQYWPDAAITISAQQYLESFYRGFGFTTVRGPYMEDGIPHLEMRLQELQPASSNRGW